jgi:hypothetical protein
MFESGMGGDFATFVGGKTEALYRLDLGKIYYQHLSEADLLSPAREKEGTLKRIPEELRCKLCGTQFSAKGNVGYDGEDNVEAFEL